jgi:hypothetical protein
VTFNAEETKAEVSCHYSRKTLEIVNAILWQTESQREFRTPLVAEAKAEIIAGRKKTSGSCSDLEKMRMKLNFST